MNDNTRRRLYYMAAVFIVFLSVFGYLGWQDVQSRQGDPGANRLDRCFSLALKADSATNVVDRAAYRRLLIEEGCI